MRDAKSGASSSLVYIFRAAWLKTRGSISRLSTARREELWSARIIFASPKATTTLVNPRARFKATPPPDALISFFYPLPPWRSLHYIASNEIILRFSTNSIWCSPFRILDSIGRVALNMCYLTRSPYLEGIHFESGITEGNNTKINEICAFTCYASCR